VPLLMHLFFCFIFYLSCQGLHIFLPRTLTCSILIVKEMEKSKLYLGDYVELSNKGIAYLVSLSFLPPPGQTSQYQSFINR
jgi:hypothetical protein